MLKQVMMAIGMAMLLGNAQAVRAHDFESDSAAIDFVLNKLEISARAEAKQNRKIAELEERIEALEASGGLAGIDCLYQTGNDLIVEGCNLHVRSGEGSTYGQDLIPNGLGNLIVGYNEGRGDGSDEKIGSHNVVIGAYHNYSSWGGFVAGVYNSVLQIGTSVSGGEDNVASGITSSVTGGNANTAAGYTTSITGGQKGVATGSMATITGGYENQARGPVASVTGGRHNVASGEAAAVTGGEHNRATGEASSVFGGDYNHAAGYAEALP